VSTSLCTCCIVEFFARNPNWALGIIFWVSVIGLNLFKTTFSNNLPKFGSRLMGLYEVGTLGGLPGLSIRIMMDSFQMTEK
jgi:hypothetical protein